MAAEKQGWLAWLWSMIPGRANAPLTQDELLKAVFDLKFTAKQFAKDSKKAAESQEKDLERVKKELAKGNVEAASLFAQNAIMHKKRSQNIQRMSVRLEALAGRLDQAAKQQAMVRMLGAASAGIQGTIDSMDLGKIGEIAEAFEKQLDDLDVGQAYVDSAIQGATASSTPEDQVKDLMLQVATQNDIELSAAIDDVNGQQQLRDLLAYRDGERTEPPTTDALRAAAAVAAGPAPAAVGGSPPTGPSAPPLPPVTE